MYCDLWLQYIQVRKLFKGGNYSRKYGNCIYVEIILLFLFHSRRWKREQQKAEIMRGFPPTYLNGPQAPNPHLAATYMANLNKAAAYAQAAAAVANNTMPRHYSYQVSFKFKFQVFSDCKEKKTQIGLFGFWENLRRANLLMVLSDLYRVNSSSCFRFLIPLVFGFPHLCDFH